MRNGLQAMMLGSALLLCAVPLSAQAQTNSPAKVTPGMSWVNEFGAVLKVSAVGSDGLLSGTYTTNVGCGAGQAQPMTGWYYPGEAGGAITFSVSWAGCDSVTAWTGQFDNATSRFQALWYLSLASAPTWNGIVAGSNYFVPQRAPEKNGKKKK